MDGNGRWARERGLPRSSGHQAGTEAARTAVTECRKRGIEHLTLYAFSSENWSRPRDEINFLFDLLVRFLKQELNTLLENSIRLNVLGRWEDMPSPVRRILKHTCSRTSGCDAMVLNLALNYSGREEIVRACREIVRQGYRAEEVNEELFHRHLYTGGQPDPDLIIRTSGEQRLSNYLIYQSAYSEFYFTQVLWPDFDGAELERAIAEYQKRQRRYGGIEES
jgi:undecaprenyl diphosphate synthase